MKKVKRCAVAVLVLITCAAFPAAALPSDAQVQATAKEWGIPADALKRLVDSYRPSTTSAGGFVSVSAEDLYAAYKANSAKADFTYKGKVLHIKGTFMELKENSYPTGDETKYYLKLKEDKSSFNMGFVHVYIPDSEVEKTFDFVANQEIEVEGTVIGFQYGDVSIKATRVLF